MRHATTMNWITLSYFRCAVRTDAEGVQPRRGIHELAKVQTCQIDEGSKWTKVIWNDISESRLNLCVILFCWLNLDILQAQIVRLIKCAQHVDLKQVARFSVKVQELNLATLASVISPYRGHTISTPGAQTLP
jgi:hypothetical protein